MFLANLLTREPSETSETRAASEPSVRRRQFIEELRFMDDTRTKRARALHGYTDTCMDTQTPIKRT